MQTVLRFHPVCKLGSVCRLSRCADCAQHIHTDTQKAGGGLATPTRRRCSDAPLAGMSMDVQTMHGRESWHASGNAFLPDVAITRLRKAQHNDIAVRSPALACPTSARASPRLRPLRPAAHRAHACPRYGAAPRAARTGLPVPQLLPPTNTFPGCAQPRASPKDNACGSIAAVCDASTGQRRRVAKSRLQQHTGICCEHRSRRARQLCIIRGVCGCAEGKDRRDCQ